MIGFILKDSVSYVKTELYLFVTPPMQTAIEKGYYVKCHPATIAEADQFNLIFQKMGQIILIYQPPTCM